MLKGLGIDRDNICRDYRVYVYAEKLHGDVQGNITLQLCAESSIVMVA